MVVSINKKTYMIQPMGICDIPDYFPIDNDEFESFDCWKNDDKKILEIQNRKYFPGGKRRT